MAGQSSARSAIECWARESSAGLCKPENNCGFIFNRMGGANLGAQPIGGGESITLGTLGPNPLGRGGGGPNPEPAIIYARCAHTCIYARVYAYMRQGSGSPLPDTMGLGKKPPPMGWGPGFDTSRLPPRWVDNKSSKSSISANLCPRRGRSNILTSTVAAAEWPI